ncbi:hypothetical protein Csa_001184 [Cucumis sativus]|uniref:Uncharacterized protein n=1 Tax=Cucumis sativus TaxID=3659 RepID=A0A0A0LDP7_CUCSA|nr:hypothetical protein Csa_001184 [Cucumis sativus]
MFRNVRYSPIFVPLFEEESHVNLKIFVVFMLFHLIRHSLGNDMEVKQERAVRLLLETILPECEFTVIHCIAAV